jgi:hypothetical protein
MRLTQMFCDELCDDEHMKCKLFKNLLQDYGAGPNHGCEVGNSGD